MLQCFRKRFINTADIIISKLAYYLTPVGVFNFRSQSKFQKATLMNQLKKKFMEIASKYTIIYGPAGEFLPEIYQFYMSYYHVD